MEKISDEQIIKMIKDNNFFAWECLYEKYSASIYGLICKLSNNKKIAEEIFTDVFLQLKTKNIIPQVKHALCPTLLRFTYSFILKELKQRGVNSISYNPSHEINLIHLFYAENNCLKNAPSISNMTEEEIKIQTRFEILNLRNRIKQKEGDSLYQKQLSNINS